MIAPEKICIGMCSKSGQIDALTVLGLLAVYAEGRVSRPPLIMLNNSDLPAARATLAHRFMTETDCEWLVLVDDDVGFQLDDWDLLWEDGESSLAVCAEYLKKIDGHRYPAQFGLGFVRVHRNVLTAMQALETLDGRPWMQQGTYAGELMWWYFPAGVNSAGEYRAEDHGFWELVRLTGCPVRIETRTHLIHTGVSRWRYDWRVLEDPGTEQLLHRRPV